MNTSIVLEFFLVLITLSLALAGNEPSMDEHIKPLISSGEGELWVMIALDEKRFRDEEDVALVESLVNYLESSGLAEWDGESSGAAAMDISFYAPSVKTAAVETAKFFNRNYSDLRYFISDEYEVLFEEQN